MSLSIASLIDAPALGARPFLTWYGADGERIELSATVTANWVAKTTNLLVEELDAGPGTLVRLDLPPHWRTAVWALATWRVGAGVVIAGPRGYGGAGQASGHVAPDDGAGQASGHVAPDDGAGRVDVLVTDRPEAAMEGELGEYDELVAQVLPSLARAFDGPLPAGALDAARVVGGFADVIVWTPPADPAAPAVVARGTTVPHGGLSTWAKDLPPAARLAVTVGGRTPRELEQFCATVLGALRTGSSLVLLPEGHPDPARIAETEHATLHS